jgi:NTE family protein
MENTIRKGEQGQEENNPIDAGMEVQMGAQELEGNAPIDAGVMPEMGAQEQEGNDPIDAGMEVQVGAQEQEENAQIDAGVMAEMAAQGPEGNAPIDAGMVVEDGAQEQEGIAPIDAGILGEVGTQEGNNPVDAGMAEDVATQENLQPEVFYPQTSYETLAVSVMEEVVPAETPKKVALILSGGGARGAFQVGAEKYAREVKGYQWDIIAGVSVGALNGAMLAMHRYTRLMEIWENISNEQVYTGGFNLPSVIKLLFGVKSFYGNEPLQKMMKQEFEAGRVIDDLHVGAVSLISGEYVGFTKEFLELPSAILASASIPVIWPPVDISPEHPAMVDGGVRNKSPVGDVLELEPDEIVIINCSAQKPSILPNAPANVLSIGMRALDLMQNEIFVSDMKEFLRINALVKEAQEQGVTLHHPSTGRPLKYYPYVIIEPDGDLGETLDFSQQSVQTSLRAGVRRAREVLGRP